MRTQHYYSGQQWAFAGMTFLGRGCWQLMRYADDQRLIPSPASSC